MPAFTNQLVNEKSPYLLQHAHNPVDWYAWQDSAFAKAQAEDKPVFLSIGYSTCHWCHVMEKESFEDADVAQLMNDTLVSIKVDREERPDIDNVYMTICQLMTGSGGWPLTIIMTPEKQPFFAATYIPKESRFGRTGMLELIPRVDELWKTERDRVLESAQQWSQRLSQVSPKSSSTALSEELLEATFYDLSKRFESNYGGFSQAPKFPTPHNLLFLLRYFYRTKDQQALDMVETTLQHMRRGGIYDHIGFGFHRYSTDVHWLVPHFEKMLYDQAMLILAYCEAFQLTKKKEYAQTAREIIAYVLRDMTSPEGGFYSAEDADSEGEEGKFYVWSEAEIRNVLKEDAEWFIPLFSVDTAGNYREEATREQTGQNILHLSKPVVEFAREQHLNPDSLFSDIEAAREKLFAVRKKRIHLLKDDKVLADWNGLMIAALANAGLILKDHNYISAAEKAASFVKQYMTQENGRLLHRYRENEASISGFVDDYCFMIFGVLELFKATQNADYLQQGLDLNKHLLAHFWDEQHGGLFSTPDDGERLLVRHKESYDGAIPSGNSVAMLNLLKLAHITGRSDFTEKADQIGRAFAELPAQSPSAYTFMMSALAFASGPSFEVVIVGSKQNTGTQAFFDALYQLYLPNTVVLLRETENGQAAIDNFSEFVQSHQQRDGKPTAFVCQNFSCQLPTTRPEKMVELLQA